MVKKLIKYLLLSNECNGSCNTCPFKFLCLTSNENTITTSSLEEYSRATVKIEVYGY